MALAVLALIVGAVSGIFVSSMKFLAASQSQADAVSRASLALQEATRGMENAILLTEAESGAVTYVLPEVDNVDCDGCYRRESESIPVLGYLRLGESRRITLSGDQISLTNPTELFGSNITSLSFLYKGPTFLLGQSSVSNPQSSVTSVTITVTAEGSSGAKRSAEVTVQQRVALSNHAPLAR